MAGIALTLLLMLVLSLSAIWMSMKMFQNYKPGRNKIQSDLKQIKAELAPLTTNLVPWTKEEMEQLSFNQINRTTKHGIVKTSKGVITTVYHEPVIAWAYKKYVGQKENGLLYARTSNQSFIYRLKNGTTEMVAGDQLIGTLSEEGLLLNSKGNKQLAQISKNENNLLKPLKVNERMVGGLALPNRKQKVNTRVFQYLNELNGEEEELVLSLAILELVRNELES